MPDGENAFRVQHNGLTRIRVNANGGIALGGNSTIIGAGNTYVAGKLGVGDNTPNARLDIDSDSGENPMVVRADGIAALVVEDDASVSVVNTLSVNTDANSHNFAVGVIGTAAKPGGGGWSVFSDKRLKKNITPIIGSLETISALRPVSFEYTEKDHFSYVEGFQMGFIAQEVQQVLPQWIGENSDGYLYIDHAGYEALVVDAIQELRAEKDQQINDLKEENEILRARLDRLEKMMDR